MVKLLIVIPALNEAEAIEDIIVRSLDARRHIIDNSPVDDVDITVVSDGSTDETVSRASAYKDRIDLIVFEKNRGYGAAIKEGWRGSDADLLGFLDADGTCDPTFFAPLCRAVVEQDADVAVGCRMTSESEMPRLRRVGNTIFASILTVFSSAKVKDAASGMRVVRRSSLPRLMPLPDGMHFTPAMSARALLGEQLRLVELDMPYRERVGTSKLSVARDGLRFLRVILTTAFLYRPGRILVSIGLLMGLVGGAIIFPSALYYVRDQKVQDWMIYRFTVSNVLILGGLLSICSGYIANTVADIALSNQESGGVQARMRRFFRHRYFWAAPIAGLAGGGILVFSSAVLYVRTGTVDTHWSRFLTMSLLVGLALVLLATKVVDWFLSLVLVRVRYLADSSDPSEEGGMWAPDDRPPIGARAEEPGSAVVPVDDERLPGPVEAPVRDEGDGRVALQPLGARLLLAPVGAAAEAVPVVEHQHRAVLHDIGDEVEHADGRAVEVAVDPDDGRDLQPEVGRLGLPQALLVEPLHHGHPGQVDPGPPQVALERRPPVGELALDELAPLVGRGAGGVGEAGEGVEGVEPHGLLAVAAGDVPRVGERVPLEHAELEVVAVHLAEGDQAEGDGEHVPLLALELGLHQSDARQDGGGPPVDRPADRTGVQERDRVRPSPGAGPDRGPAEGE
jgi:glycosyltransferase involved in cell wall biosynthesis